MPKITDVDAAIVAAQEELDRGGSSRNKWTVHLPTADYLRLLLLCREEGQNPAQFGLTALTRYADATENGVVLSLPADFRTRLDFVAESLGLDRVAMVRVILSEHLPSYYTTAIERRAKNDQFEAATGRERKHEKRK